MKPAKGQALVGRLQPLVVHSIKSLAVWLGVDVNFTL